MPARLQAPVMTLDHTDPPTEEVRAGFMPSGRLRAAMNFSNTVIASRDRGDGEPGGVTAALARELARRLGAELVFIDYESPGAVVDAIQAGQADICFLAIEPKRREAIDFSAPYVLIESNFVARADGPFRTSDDVDRAGVTVITRARAAYDLYLSRNLKAARVLPIPDGELDAFVAGQGDVASGIRPMLEDYFKGRPGYRILEPPFASVGQAMGLAKGRGEAFAYLEAFVEELKASGFIQAALKESGSRATVAPPAEHIA
ncbi:MAG: transporter substrate-binding domain-containing protein [Caulobacteraceae bacterium]